MNELHELIKQLDSLPNNSARKDFLNSLLKNKDLPKYHNQRLACNILIQDNFIEKYYRESLGITIKKKFFKITLIFRKLFEKVKLKRLK